METTTFSTKSTVCTSTQSIIQHNVKIVNLKVIIPAVVFSFSSGESKPRRMRVAQDFISRNHIELTIRKGEIVEVCMNDTTLSVLLFLKPCNSWIICFLYPQVLDTSKQWWNVRNSRGEEGFVPNNVLDASDEQTNEVRAMWQKHNSTDAYKFSCMEHWLIKSNTARLFYCPHEKGKGYES